MYLLKLEQSEINGILLVVLLVLVLPIVIKILKVPFFKYKTDIHLNTEMKVLSIEAAINGIITIDGHGTILQWNGGAERMIGWRETEVLGKNVTIIIPPRLRESHIAGLERARATGYGTILGRPVELICLHKTGREFNISLKLNREERNGATFFIGVIRDTTKDVFERKKMQDYLKLYQQGEDILQCGTWQWNVTEDIVEGTRGFKRIFDEDEVSAPASFFLQKVWKGHRKAVDAAIKNAVATKEGYKINYGVVRNNGTVAIIHCDAVVRNHIPSGEVAPVLYIVGAVRVVAIVDINNVQSFELLNL